ncbi:hypothetical protein [Planctomicrobium sp. SH527]|uniref:hypothetical protein n=1 Tax=Planctomicrobium sp. SH527 TaxID=3448123 RepID=UPI003F5B8CFF
MGARQRLNSLYFTGILIIAAVCGVVADSWGIFAGVTIVLAAILIHGGNIRPNPTFRKPRRFRRR